MASPNDENNYTPPSLDDDAVTYLPIDKQKESRIPFGPTDLRGASATGGMRVGQPFVFVADDAMPSLSAPKVAEACDNVVKGSHTWASVLYVSRAQPSDIPLLLAASESYEIKVRWERLWVLSPFLSRLSRREAGQQALTAALAEDVAGLHLMSKFAEQKNPNVVRLFQRLKPHLLPKLLSKVVEHLAEPRKLALLSSIIAAFETDEQALARTFLPDVPASKRAQALTMLYHVPAKEKAKTLSSTTLRERLETWRPAR